MRLYSLALKLGVASLAAGLFAGSLLGADGTAQDSKGEKKDAGAQDAPKPDDAKARPRRPAAGKRTEEVLADRLLKEHPEADTNKDGKISADELRAWRRDHPAVPQGRRLEEFLKNHPEADKDKDGKISTEEMREYLKASPPLPQGKRLEQLLKQHPEIDKDKDGKVSREELREYRRQRIEAEKKDVKSGSPGDSKSGEQKSEQKSGEQNVKKPEQL